MKKDHFKAGDHVSFLNEKQDGIIRDITEGGRIIVELEDGFSLEVGPGELVLVKRPATAASTFVKVMDEAAIIEKVHHVQNICELLPIRDELYLILLPTENQISSGPVKLYLANSTPFHFVYTLHTVRNKKLHGLHFGTLEPGKSHFITELKREQFFDSGELDFDALLFDYKPHHTTSRVHKSIQLSPPALSQTFPLLSSPYCFSKTITLHASVQTEDIDDKVIFEKLISQYADKGKQKSIGHADKSKNKQTLFTQPYGISPANFEVDLHIEELIENFEKLNNAAIIEIQLKHFRKELDKALLRHSKSIVFIHGIGNGKLKSEIRKELNALGYKFTDAPYQRYGSGATEVIL